MKAYKAEVLILDFERCGADSIKVALENARHIYPSVKNITEAEIGEWDDDHPLNRRDTSTAEYHRLFEDPKQKALQESWHKLFATLSDIAVAAGMSPEKLASVAESMACDMGDGREILELVKHRIKEFEDFKCQICNGSGTVWVGEDEDRPAKCYQCGGRGTKCKL